MAADVPSSGTSSAIAKGGAVFDYSRDVPFEVPAFGREAIETAYALKQMITVGVRVFFYLEDRERTLDSPADKLMLSIWSARVSGRHRSGRADGARPGRGWRVY